MISKENLCKEKTKNSLKKRGKTLLLKICRMRKEREKFRDLTISQSKMKRPLFRSMLKAKNSKRLSRMTSKFSNF